MGKKVAFKCAIDDNNLECDEDELDTILEQISNSDNNVRFVSSREVWIGKSPFSITAIRRRLSHRALNNLKVIQVIYDTKSSGNSYADYK